MDVVVVRQRWRLTFAMFREAAFQHTHHGGMMKQSSARVTRSSIRSTSTVFALLAVLVLILSACAGAPAAPTELPTVAVQSTTAPVATQPPATDAPTAAPANTVAPTAAPANTVAPTAAPANTVAPTQAPSATTEPTAESTVAATAAPVASAAGAASFKNDVMPIFEQRCINCHGGERTRGGLDLKTYESLMKGGEDGEALKPGNPDDSKMVELIVEGKMPKREDPLTADQIAVIKAWIAQGAQNN